MEEVVLKFVEFFSRAILAVVGIWAGFCVAGICGSVILTFACFMCLHISADQTHGLEVKEVLERDIRILL